MKKLWILVTVLLALSVGLSGCAEAGSAADGLSASGTIYADQVSISPEMNEKVLAVNVQEGQVVSVGEVLFTQDDATLKAQYDQVVAQVAAAEATLAAAEAQLESARTQYELALAGAYLQDTWKRSDLWQMMTPEEVGLPTWYFDKGEYLTAVETEIEDAFSAVEVERANLDKVLADVSNEDFVEAEKNMVKARSSYLVARTIRDQALGALDGEEIVQAAEDQYNLALQDMEAARLAYNRLLSTESARRVNEARARLAVAQARLETGQISRAQAQSGLDSLQVKAAQAQVRQAETAVTQAQANQSQAQAALKLIELQLGRAAVEAPVAGTILARNIEAGEFAAAGSVALTIGKLEQVRLVVYVAEDVYGTIRLEQTVQVSVDSYPGRIFNGTVARIADQAEFTPRNVSTAEGRKSTVFAVEILIPNPDGALKPGMPADVEFGG